MLTMEENSIICEMKFNYKLTNDDDVVKDEQAGTKVK